MRGILYQTLKDRLQHNRGSALATVVQGAENLGAKLLILPDGSTQGSLHHRELEARVIAEALPVIWSGTARTSTYKIGPDQSYEVFIEGFPPPSRLIIIGAGHIAIPLTSIAKTLDYEVIVVDARAAFATRERFPHADEVIVEWPDTYLEQAELDPTTAIAVLTHDPKFDEPALKAALKAQVGYIGAIGSRQTSTERAERLRQQGVDPEQIKRIHGPIGLRLGGASPAEIALSIMAEIVAVRYGKLSETSSLQSAT